MKCSACGALWEVPPFSVPPPAGADEGGEAKPVERPRPTELTVTIVLCDLGAVALLLGGIAGVVSAFAARGSGQGMAGSGLACYRIVLALSVIVLTHYLWRGTEWARLAMLTVAGLDFACLVLASIFSSGDAATPANMVIVLWAFAILRGKKTRLYCKRTP